MHRQPILHGHINAYQALTGKSSSDKISARAFALRSSISADVKCAIAASSSWVAVPAASSLRISGLN